MTTAEKVASVQAKVQDDLATDALITELLEDAAEDIFLRMYPKGRPASVTDVPAMYERLQCRLAANKFYRMGADAEQTHNENGIHRHYGSVNDEELLMEVMQVITL